MPKEGKVPKLNGKFVTRAAYEAAQVVEAESVAVEEKSVTDEVDENFVPVARGPEDKRFGLRPATALKRALAEQVDSRVAVAKAVTARDAFVDRTSELAAAVQAATERQAAADAAVIEATARFAG